MCVTVCIIRCVMVVRQQKTIQISSGFRGAVVTSSGVERERDSALWMNPPPTTTTTTTTAINRVIIYILIIIRNLNPGASINICIDSFYVYLSSNMVYHTSVVRIIFSFSSYYRSDSDAFLFQSIFILMLKLCVNICVFSIDGNISWRYLTSGYVCVWVCVL